MSRWGGGRWAMAACLLGFALPLDNAGAAVPAGVGSPPSNAERKALSHLLASGTAAAFNAREAIKPNDIPTVVIGDNWGNGKPRNLFSGKRYLDAKIVGGGIDPDPQNLDRLRPRLPHHRSARRRAELLRRRPLLQVRRPALRPARYHHLWLRHAAPRAVHALGERPGQGLPGQRELGLELPARHRLSAELADRADGEGLGAAGRLDRDRLADGDVAQRLAGRRLGRQAPVGEAGLGRSDQRPGVRLPPGSS